MNSSHKLTGALKARCPNLRLTTEAEVCARLGKDWSIAPSGRPAAVVWPDNTDEVVAIVRAANELGLSLVPSGGRTGLSGGATAADGEVVVSMDRFNALSSVQPAGRLIDAGAGVVTAQLQAQAADDGFFYPVDFASSGSSQVGGNIATNAGGIRVLRYGMTRDWVAGLEVVTGTGEVLSLGRGLVKDATGPDLKQLMIGSEGVLGIITQTRMRVTSQPPNQQVVLLALSSIDAVLPLFAACRRHLQLSAFEYFSDTCVDYLLNHRDLARPLDDAAEHYVLLEADEDEAAVLALFEHAAEQDWVVDGVISQSKAQAEELWQYREGISESLAPMRPYKNDVVVPVSEVGRFLTELDKLVAEQYPDFSTAWFGHVGDGNLHLNILPPKGMAHSDFSRECQRVNELVFALVDQLGGSISAEHGIGTLKRPYLHHSVSTTEISLLGALKAQLDPNGILNPGKLIPDHG
ncbi:MAG: FAD-linked oxidase [Lysobacteraceae bacterium]|nr:MAG: FAD-linked oxidase [Xanthomonadaceae bacterium]